MGSTQQNRNVRNDITYISLLLGFHNKDDSNKCFYQPSITIYVMYVTFSINPEEGRMYVYLPFHPNSNVQR